MGYGNPAPKKAVKTAAKKITKKKGQSGFSGKKYVQASE